MKIIHDSVIRSKKFVTIVLKIDIEGFECRTFLGSTNIFQIRDVSIPYIFMEWDFMDKKSSCPPSMLKNLTTLFLENGYKVNYIKHLTPLAFVIEEQDKFD